MVTYQGPSLGARLITLLVGAGCSLIWFAVLGGLLLAGRRYLWLPWFWEIAVIRAAAEYAEALWARLVSRRQLELELRARTLNPRDSRARYNLGVIYMRQRRFDLAAHELTASLSINPDRTDAHYRLGWCSAELGRIEEAVGPLLACLERRGDHYEAQLLVATCYTGLGRLEEARVVLERFLGPRPDDVEAWYRMGIVEASSDNVEAASERLAGCIERSHHSAPQNRRRDRRLARLARGKLRELRR
jgi:tetratricopeptide (TPR) repeat protein